MPFKSFNRQYFATGGLRKATTSVTVTLPRISKDDPLYEVLTDDDVGIDFSTGRPKIAKDVLDEMRQYLSVEDPSEHKARVERIRRQVWELEKSSHGQKALLRMEEAPGYTSNLNKGKGIVFGYEESNDNVPRGEKLMASAIESGRSPCLADKDKLQSASVAVWRKQLTLVMFLRVLKLVLGLVVPETKPIRCQREEGQVNGGVKLKLLKELTLEKRRNKIRVQREVQFWRKGKKLLMRLKFHQNSPSA